MEKAWCGRVVDWRIYHAGYWGRRGSTKTKGSGFLSGGDDLSFFLFFCTHQLPSIPSMSTSSRHGCMNKSPAHVFPRIPLMLTWLPLFYSQRLLSSICLFRVCCCTCLMRSTAQLHLLSHCNYPCAVGCPFGSLSAR
ncbi:hypothetical protein BS17DRAFT_565523 [Gyrodon lividus]|nr:hypothetical protein BS17DRAFT_565523 [Gyrodon lividus]